MDISKDVARKTFIRRHHLEYDIMKLTKIRRDFHEDKRTDCRFNH